MSLPVFVLHTVGAVDESLTSEAGHITGVITDQGPVEAEYVVLCGGMWTRQLGLAAGVTLPLYPVEHQQHVAQPLDLIAFGTLGRAGGKEQQHRAQDRARHRAQHEPVEPAADEHAKQRDPG